MICFTVPCQTYSTLNMKGQHWRKKHRISKGQRDTVILAWACRHDNGSEPKKHWKAIGVPALVTMTRVVPDMRNWIKDDDNLRASLKHVRDELARQMGYDDKDGSGLRWDYKQEVLRKKGYHAVDVRIERDKQ